MRNRGFTLVELMVTVAIVAILAAIAFPSFEGSMRSNRVATATNELLASVSLARSEAIRNPNGAVVCTSSAGTACDGDWSDGWLVFVDGDGDGALDSDDRVVRYSQTHSRLDVTASSPGGSDAAKLIRFDSRGRLRSDDASVRTVVIKPSTCAGGQQLVRTIEIRATGQPQVVRGNCS